MHNPIQEIALGHVATAQPLTNTGPASHQGTAPSAVSISARVALARCWRLVEWGRSLSKVAEAPDTKHCSLRTHRVAASSESSVRCEHLGRQPLASL